MARRATAARTPQAGPGHGARLPARAAAAGDGRVRRRATASSRRRCRWSSRRRASRATRSTSSSRQDRLLPGRLRRGRRRAARGARGADGRAGLDPGDAQGRRPLPAAGGRSVRRSLARTCSRCRAAGERTLEQRDRTYAMYQAMFADLARRARAEQPDLPPLSPLVPRVLVLAITELVAEEVRAGRTEQPRATCRTISRGSRSGCSPTTPRLSAPSPRATPARHRAIRPAPAGVQLRLGIARELGHLLEGRAADSGARARRRARRRCVATVTARRSLSPQSAQRSSEIERAASSERHAVGVSRRGPARRGSRGRPSAHGPTPWSASGP